MQTRRISLIFHLAALYDGLLGLAFLLIPYGIYGWAGVEPPNHIGYVQFPALLLLIFAWMFCQIAAQPQQRRPLIPYGITLKCAYFLVVLGHWFTSGIPGMWKPFAFLDALWALLFFMAYTSLGKQGALR